MNTTALETYYRIVAKCGKFSDILFRLFFGVNCTIFIENLCFRYSCRQIQTILQVIFFVFYFLIIDFSESYDERIIMIYHLSIKINIYITIKAIEFLET